MRKGKIGDSEVGVIGLGCMGMSFAYGPSDEDECLRVLDRALELGSNHWDTADMYGAGENEKLLAKALKTRRNEVFLATKFGNVADRSLTSHQDLVAQNAGWIVDGTPEYVQKCCDNSLRRLGVEIIDLYYQHRVDDRVPIEETVGAMAKLVEQGKVRHLGLSEAAAETVRRAHKTHPIAALQSEYSLWSRDPEGELIATLRERGIVLVPYSPLGRGFLTGRFKSPEDLPEGDWRRNNPRFQGENFTKNQELVAKIDEIAQRKKVAASQVALAWVLAQGEDMRPIPGTKQVKYLELNAASEKVTFTAEELEELSDFEVSGTRYPEQMMSFVGR